MRYVIAIVLCGVEVLIYGAVLAALGATSQSDAAGNPMGRLLVLAPLVLIVGATWGAITKQGFPSALDPFGILGDQAPRGDARLGRHYNELGNDLRMRGNLKGAVAEYRRALEEDPNCELVSAERIN